MACVQVGDGPTVVHRDLVTLKIRLFSSTIALKPVDNGNQS